MILIQYSPLRWKSAAFSPRGFYKDKSAFKATVGDDHDTVYFTLFHSRLKKSMKYEILNTSADCRNQT